MYICSDKGSGKKNWPGENESVNSRQKEFCWQDYIFLKNQKRYSAISGITEK